MVVRKKSDTIQLSKIRMLEDLRRRLVREAERKRITLNAEIVSRLEQSFEERDTQDSVRNRDELITAMLGGTEGSNLLHWIAHQLNGDHRKWLTSDEAVRNFADAVRDRIIQRYIDDFKTFQGERQ